jgi:ABC-type Na+ efflux pump permease subunit
MAGFFLRHLLKAFQTVPANRRPIDWSDLADPMNHWVVVVGTGLSCVTGLAIALRAAGSITGERARQTFDTLLTTPLSTTSILFGKLVGSILCVRGLGCWLVLVGMCGLVSGGLGWAALAQLTVAWLVFAIFWALVGLGYSTLFRKTLLASIATLLTALLITVSPWIVWLMLDVFSKLTRDQHVHEHHIDGIFFLSPPATLAFLASNRPLIRIGPEPYATSWRLAWLSLGCFSVASLMLWFWVRRRFRRLSLRTGSDESLRPEHKPVLVAVPEKPQQASQPSQAA